MATRYWFRHAHATHAIERQAPIHLVAATLGHASVATTGRYLHARPTDSSARYLAVCNTRVPPRGRRYRSSCAAPPAGAAGDPRRSVRRRRNARAFRRLPQNRM
jgi:Phage integrase family